MNNIKFLKLVKETAILNDVIDTQLPFFKKRGLAFGASGYIQIEEHLFNICVAAFERFPEKELEFFLLNQDQFEVIPHVEENGLVCYTNDDNLVLDIENPCGIIKESLELVLRTLLDGIKKRNHDDFYNEYEAYWRRFKSEIAVFANILVSEEVSLIKYTKIKGTSNFFATNDSTEYLKSYSRFFGTKENPSYFNGIYIPLLPASKILIPEANAPLSLHFIIEMIQNHVSLNNRKKIKHLLSKTKGEDLIIFSLLQPNGYYSLFGIRLKGISHCIHPFIGENTRSTIFPFSVIRLDADFMLARGGIGRSFLEQKVLVIGAGSIGSAICEEIIKAGIVNLSVIDKDILLPENCYRHSCGFKYVNNKKAEAIKLKLELYYPHSQIQTFNLSIEDAIDNEKISLKDYDAVIVATGNANTNQYLNKLFKKEFHRIPLLFSWLDPFGIGGHCLVSNISDKGCYQCLYSNNDLHNIASFAAPLQHKSFSKSISGCGSMYVPYGSLDALQTAILTVRKLLEVLSKEETQNSIVSWKGDPTTFLSAGYKLSPRFHQDEQHLLAAKTLFYKNNCSICGN